MRESLGFARAPTTSFLAPPSIKDPIISSSANLNEVVLEPTFVYDVTTEAGRSYSFTARP